MRRFMLVHAGILLEIPSHLHHETACACWYFSPVITYQGWVVWHISASFLSYCVPSGTPLPCNTTISFWISVLVLTSQISFWWDNPRLTGVQYTWHEPWSQSLISVVFCTWWRPKRLCYLHFSLTPMDVGVWSWNMQSHSSCASVLSCVTTLSVNH